MLPKSKRMNGDEINLLFSSGKSLKNPLFIMKYGKNQADPAKKGAQKTVFAVAASKKVFKTAVLRNKARRRVYNAIRAAKVDTLLSSLSLLIVIIPNHEALEASYKALVSAVESSCKLLIKY